MASISLATTKRLFGRAGNRCAFPDCAEQIIHDNGHIAGEVCHIKARNAGGPRYDAGQSMKERNAQENLIILCSNHHKAIDAQPAIYTAQILLEMKALAEAVHGRPPRSTDEIYARLLMAHSQPISILAGTSNVAVNSPNAIQTNIFNLRQSRKSIAVNAPPDSIGANGNAVRYAEYLIKRYNEFARSEPTRSRAFSFAAIRKNIEHQFGASWKLLPLVRFEEFCEYLQSRIARTRIAKFNKSKGIRSFSSFEEFKQKHSGQSERII